MEVRVTEAEFDDYVGSLEFNIDTLSINILEDMVKQTISENECGAVIYGQTRMGKTRAIKSVINSLKGSYGNDFPVFYMTETRHTVSQKAFYQEVLKALGLGLLPGNTEVLRTRTVNAITALCHKAKSQRFVLFIDEATLLSLDEYYWLMDFSNLISGNDLIMTVFLVGLPGILEKQWELDSIGEAQIVNRFMLTQYEFNGIRDKWGVAACLKNFDQPMRFHGNDVIWAQYFFPHFFGEENKISTCFEDYWNALMEINKEHDIHFGELPMSVFVKSVAYCFKKYGVLGKGILSPGMKEWKDSIQSAKYLQMMRAK